MNNGLTPANDSAIKMTLTPSNIINIDKLAKKLENYKPETYIEKSLKKNILNLKLNGRELKHKNTFIEQVKRNSIKNYVLDLNNKHKKTQINAFSKNMKQFQKSIESVLQNKNIELKIYMDKYDKILEENKELKHQIFLLNSEQFNFKQQKKANAEEFIKTKLELKKFEKHKKLLNSIERDYDNIEPNEIIQKMEEKRKNIKNL